MPWYSLDMELKELILQRLRSTHMMQVATLSGDQPWCCTVYFVADEACNLYWISTPGRRHSREIEAHGKAAAAIPVRFAEGEPVVGVQVEGEALRIQDEAILKKAVRLYDERFRHDQAFYEDFVAGRRQHKFYMIKPRLLVLFDEQTFTENPRREWRPEHEAI